MGTERSGDAAVKERTLHYQFHNPNPAAAAADCIIKIFMEANAEKVAAAMEEALRGASGSPLHEGRGEAPPV